MVPLSTRMRRAPQPETNEFRWEFRSEKPIRARAYGLPDPKALTMGTETGKRSAMGGCGEAWRRITIYVAGTFALENSVPALARLFKRTLC